jgi:tetratricopeptide (TPR) repeat protein
MAAGFSLRSLRAPALLAVGLSVALALTPAGARAAAQSPAPDAAAAARDELARATALAAAGQREEAAALIAQAIAAGRPEAALYGSAWRAAVAVRDADVMIQVIEAAARNVAEADRAPLWTAIDMTYVGQLDRFPHSGDRAAWRDRLATALVALDWPGPDDPEATDYFRSILIDSALGRHDRSRAAALARTIVTPDSLISMLTSRRYDGLLQGDAAATLDRAIANLDRVSAAAAAARPDDYMAILVRAHFLRGVGRYDEALTLLRPYLADVAATTAHDAQGMWLINEAASVLQRLGRSAEAVALMRQLVALDLGAYPELIGPRINFAGLLVKTGHAEEALAYAAGMESQLSQGANEFGRTLMASTVVCALSNLGRAGEAAPRIERMRAQASANWKALHEAYLCLNDLDSAEALLIRQLGGAQPEDAILMLQDYRPDVPSAVDAALRQRFDTLRARPAVVAALARVGRVMRLPYPWSEAPAF